MCGIAGFIRLAGNNSNSSAFIDWFGSMAEKSLARGPDAMGLVAFELDRHVAPSLFKLDCRKLSDEARQELLKCALKNYAQSPGISMNFRGVPTTEQYGHDRLEREEIQPFLAYRISVAHNGLLANDRDLTARYNLPRLSRLGDHDIDSYIFLAMAVRFSTRYALDHIEGSWSLALIDHNNSYLLLSRTFLGLHLAVVEENGGIYLVWSSEPFPSVPDLATTAYFQWEMPPYHKLGLDLNLLSLRASAVQLAKGFQIKTIPIAESETDKCAVILSGGLDSTVAATMACQQYKEVHLLHFLYGARAQARESQAVIDIANVLTSRFPDCKVTAQFVDLQYLQELGGSTLTDHSLAIAEGEKGIETAHEWVPARNLVMASMAAAYCDRYKIGAIMLGTNREESAVYSDNSSEFHRALSATLQLCTNTRPVIHAPLENMMKSHIYAKALRIDAPIHLAWSCYTGGEASNNVHCGVCGPCLLRQTAAAMCGVQDNIPYHQAATVTIK